VRFRSLLIAALMGTALLPAMYSNPVSAQGDAKVRVAHFSPDAEAVDIYIDGKKKMNNVPYLAMSEYVSLPAGQHTFDVRAAGSLATSPALLTNAQSLAAGSSYTVAAIGPVATMTAGVFTDKITTPGTGKSKVRVIHAADGTADVDVALKTGAVAFPKVAFGTATEYSEVDAGSYDLQILSSGSSAVVLAKNVTLQAGGVYTIAAVGGADKPPTLRGFVDLTPGAAAAPAVVAVSVTTTAVKGAGETKPTKTTTAAGATTTPPVTEPPVTVTTIAPATQDTVATTDAAVATDTVPTATAVSPTTTAAEAAVADTAVTDTTVTDTTVVAATQDTVAPATATPKGGVATGFGGMSNTQSSAALVVLGLIAMGAVLVGRSRRRSHR
jgi:Domain of unknown function (DUF4397)